MTITFQELKEKLKHEDEVTLLELLNITSLELVDQLEEHIYEQQEKLREYYGEIDTQEER